jgi:hypothetical protein
MKKVKLKNVAIGLVVAVGLYVLGGFVKNGQSKYELMTFAEIRQAIDDGLRPAQVAKPEGQPTLTLRERELRVQEAQAQAQAAQAQAALASAAALERAAAAAEQQAAAAQDQAQTAEWMARQLQPVCTVKSYVDEYGYRRYYQSCR